MSYNGALQDLFAGVRDMVERPYVGWFVDGLEFLPESCEECRILQKIMGHNSIRTTLGWYTHLTDDDIMTETLALMDRDKSLCSFDDSNAVTGTSAKKELVIKPDYSKRVPRNKGKKDRSRTMEQGNASWQEGK